MWPPQNSVLDCGGAGRQHRSPACSPTPFPPSRLWRHENSHTGLVDFHLCVQADPLQKAPPWPFRDWQRGLSRRDRREEGPMWPRAPGEYSRSQNMDLTHESAAPGTGFLLPGSKGSANEASSFLLLRKWFLP